MFRKQSRGGTDTLNVPRPPQDEIPKSATHGQEVIFLGWQRTQTGEICFPLYTILRVGHPLYRSTVSAKTLRAQHFRIPRTPSPYPGVAQHPWHEAGIELDNPASAKEAIEAAGLDYTVVKRPMREFVRRKHVDDVVDRWVTVRTDTGDVLGIVEDDCEPVQNRDAFRCLDNLISTDEMVYETAGMIGRGERIWILAKLPGFIKVNGRDIVDRYLLLSNSHTGSLNVRVKIMPIRVVCNNTLTAVLQGAGDITLRQTSGASEDQALSLLGLTDHLYEKLDACFNHMARTKISEKQLLDYVNALVPDGAGGEDTAKIIGIRNTFLDLYESGQGADLSRGTLWGAFNCVTEYTDHVMEGDPAARLESIWFGGGDRLKVRAFQLAERMM